ncbi:hypothetical protein ABW19_dt0209335 [Dactylella cylindrospora]|nr:hypothetical protein ABW19_dt0209335 [Dactylella cylindrospora]
MSHKGKSSSKVDSGIGSSLGSHLAPQSRLNASENSIGGERNQVQYGNVNNYFVNHNAGPPPLAPVPPSFPSPQQVDSHSRDHNYERESHDRAGPLIKTPRRTRRRERDEEDTGSLDLTELNIQLISREYHQAHADFMDLKVGSGKTIKGCAAHLKSLRAISDSNKRLRNDTYLQILKGNILHLQAIALFKKSKAADTTNDQCRILKDSVDVIDEAYETFEEIFVEEGEWRTQKTIDKQLFQILMDQSTIHAEISRVKRRKAQELGKNFLPGGGYGMLGDDHSVRSGG